MAGFFDPLLNPLAWFDVEAVPEGWFAPELVPLASPLPVVTAFLSVTHSARITTPRVASLDEEGDRQRNQHDREQDENDGQANDPLRQAVARPSGRHDG